MDDYTEYKKEIMNKLKGKKLLYLGGTALSIDIIETANRLGVYTIVTDWNTPELSPAKRHAKEAWNISISDIEQLAHLVKTNHIDGILTNYTDSYLPYYVRLCEKCKLPCLATEEQIEMISNKSLSKKMCAEHGIAVSKRYPVSSIEDIRNLHDIVFPVLTKPVDNSGQRGIFVCKNKEDLIKKYEESLKFSSSNNVMVEEYVQGDYTVMFYTIQNGHTTLSTMADKPVIGEFIDNLPKLPQGYLLPSKHVDLCEKNMLPKVQSLVNDLGIKNGIIGVEAVVKENDIFVFEMQFRLGGMRHHNFVFKENGMDILSMLLNFALTGEFAGWDTTIFDNPHFKNCYCSLNILIEPDRVVRIEGLERAKSLPQVTNFTQMLEEGESVRLPGTVQQIIFKFSLVENSWNRLRSVIEDIYNSLRVYNDKGENIIIPPTFLDSISNNC